jgi:hypothetical protein
VSKKPKRTRHRIPACAYQPAPDLIDDRYQAQIDASVARLERAYRKAQKALSAAEERLSRAETKPAPPALIVNLRTEVDTRERELREIELLMMPGNYAGRQHRAFTARHTHG